MTGRVAETAAVTALAACLTLAMAVPVLRAPSERVFGMESVGRHHDPFTVMQQFVRPLTIGVYLQPVTDIPGALLARLSGAVAAYNWLVLLTFPLSAAAAYALARYLALSRAAAVMAAIAFAFSPFHVAHAAYHPHIAQTQWMPLYFLALWRCLDRGTLTAVGVLGLAIAAVTLSNFYGGLIAAVMTPPAIAAHWWFRARHQPEAARRLAVTVAGLAGVAAIGVAYVWYVAQPVVDDPAAFAFVREDLFRYSAKWWSYLVPPIAHPLFGAAAHSLWATVGVHEGLLEQQVTLGAGVVVLASVALLYWMMRDRVSPPVAAVPMLAIVAGIALLCSLSPERGIGTVTFPALSAMLYPILPMFRSYARFAVVVQLMTALLAAIGAERLWRGGGRRHRVACAALVTLAASEYLVSPSALWRDVLPTTAHRWVAQQLGPMRALDCAPLTPETASIEWLTANRVSLLRGSSDDCTEPDFAARASAEGYTHLLVRHDTAEGRWFTSQPAPHGLQVAARFDDGAVFAVAPRSTLVYTLRMNAFYSREYDRTSTWRWMGPPASWTIVNMSSRPVVAGVDITMASFHGVRRLGLLLDGRKVQTLVVEEGREVNRIGPLPLTPGHHELTFQPAEPATPAGGVMKNGDPRALSIAIGSWDWIVESE